MNFSKQEITAAVKYALEAELETTPKPGLIDKRNNGSHTDMDYIMMTESISETVRGVWRFLEEVDAWRKEDGKDIRKLSSALKRSGQATEALMRGRFGVNTHNGALFSSGLISVSAYMTGSRRTCDIGVYIKEVAECYERADNTKGAAAVKEYGVKGALDNARDGYREVFEKYLPYYRKNRQEQNENDARVKLLLYIIRSLGDTNLYVRGGKEGAEWAAARADEVLTETERKGYSRSMVEELDDEFIKRRLSPGGSADMLALTVLCDKLSFE